MLILSLLWRLINGLWDLSNFMRIVNYVVDNGYKFVWEFGNGKWNIIMVLFWKFLYDNKF